MEKKLEKNINEKKVTEKPKKRKKTIKAYPTGRQKDGTDPF